MKGTKSSAITTFNVFTVFQDQVEFQLVVRTATRNLDRSSFDIGILFDLFRLHINVTSKRAIIKIIFPLQIYLPIIRIDIMECPAFEATFIRRKQINKKISGNQRIRFGNDLEEMKFIIGMGTVVFIILYGPIIQRIVLAIVAQFILGFDIGLNFIFILGAGKDSCAYKKQGED